MARGEADLPFTCPHCGEKFGTGSGVALLSVVRSASFEEPMPCCGVVTKATMTRGDDGYITIEYDKETVDGE